MKNIGWVFFAFINLCVFTSLGDVPWELGASLAEPSFWKSDPVLLVRKYHEKCGLKFTSESRDFADTRRDGAITCFGIPVYETRIAFSKEGILRVELTLYSNAGTEILEELPAQRAGTRMFRNKRIDKPITRDRYFEILEAVSAKLTATGKREPTPVRTKLRDLKARQFSQTWPKTVVSTVATLTWNYSQMGKKTNTFEPGFIRLAVDGPEAAGTVSDPAKVGIRFGSITSNVVRDPRGDVFIDNIPMVDQGQKGYCAAAASERVLRYYGMNVDEHEIAQAAGTSVDNGTDVAAMKYSVEAIGKRCRLATVTLYGDFDKDSGRRIGNLAKEVSAYNKTAKKLRKPMITEDVYLKRNGNMVSYNPGALQEAMDPEVLKDMKTNGAQKAKYMKFRKDVHQWINEGRPILWGVTLGTYPEDNLPQARGGHMRLIIGYNDKKDELLYSDTWGKGHELKRMPMAWAWTISHCLVGLKPLR